MKLKSSEGQKPLHLVGDPLIGTHPAGASGTFTPIIQLVEVGCRKMNRVGIENPILSDICGMLGDEWKELAIHLGFDDANIREFEVNNPGNVRHQRFQMLTEWRRRQPSTEGRMDRLCRALEKIYRNDIVVWLQGRPVISGLTALEYCQQKLTRRYKKTASTIPAHPFDPSRTVAMGRFYSDLELTQGLKGKQTSKENIRLKEEARILDKVRTVPLNSWEDMLNIDTEEGESLKILVSGGAGFGKSTLLLRVANASTDPGTLMARFKLVFLVFLRQMQESSCVLKAICDQIFSKDNQFGEADLKNVIDENKAETVFLLDGLDEIPSSVLNSPAKEGEYGVKAILENRVLVESCVIVTTRPHMIDLKKYPYYARVETRGFTFKTCKKYIAEYFAENVPLGDTLMSNLETNESLQTLARIPIIVLLLCIVWQSLSKLPERLTELYTDFSEVLVSRRCNEGEDRSELMKSVQSRLGRVALNGLLDPKGERLIFSSKEFGEKELEDGCRLGFLQKEHLTSVLKEMYVVTFLHKSFQEYSAACYLDSLYSLVGKRGFLDELKRINADNVYAMKDLLRFTCGISSESPATGFILEHVRESKKGEELGLQDLARELLFESSSSKWAGKLERPTEVYCDNHEDVLKALQYYLQCLPRPPVKIAQFTVYCRSCDDITILRDILLSGKIRPTISLFTRFRALLSGGPLPSWSYNYTMTDRGSHAMQTLEETLQGMDKRIRDRLVLNLTIAKSSCFDDECVLGYLPYVSNQLKNVFVCYRSYNDVSRLMNALQGCSRLKWVDLHYTNLHNNVQCLASLISPSLTWLTLRSCGLDDDDIPDLIRIIPAGHGCLYILDVKGSAFSVDGLETLCTHLQSLPALRSFHVSYTGPNVKSLKSTVRQYLPKVRLWNVNDY